MDELQALQEEAAVAFEGTIDNVFLPPSVSRADIASGTSYSHFALAPSSSEDIDYVLGVDEAGRGPVLGPMVYGVFFLPCSVERQLLAETHHFDDSKVLTPAVRSNLMRHLCTPETDLHQVSGWATRVMSARDIAAGMLKANGAYNLNAQAMDATADLISGVLARGVNVKEIYVDTIGSPAIYQKRLERIFPTIKITVAKKADSLYPCVSAASVCAKVTRDAALEVAYELYANATGSSGGWGSGYPSDARCTTWLKKNMDPMFGWGPDCRFSWGTAKDMIEAKGISIPVDWPEEDPDDNLKVSSFFARPTTGGDDRTAVAKWYGQHISEAVF